MKTVESEDKNKVLKIGAAVGCVLLAAGLLWYNYWPEKKFSTSQAYFTDDDGATWYIDSVDNIPPYMHNGKEAVSINMYTYANGSKDLPGFLMKFPDDAKKSIEEQAKKQGVKPHEIAYAGTTPTEMLTKSPQKKMDWVAVTSPQGAKVMTVTAPDGSTLDSKVPTE